MYVQQQRIYCRASLIGLRVMVQDQGLDPLHKLPLAALIESVICTSAPCRHVTQP